MRISNKVIKKQKKQKTALQHLVHPWRSKLCEWKRGRDEHSFHKSRKLKGVTSGVGEVSSFVRMPCWIHSCPLQIMLPKFSSTIVNISYKKGTITLVYLSQKLPYLKNNGLVVLLEVEGEDISEHECGAALAQHIHSLLQKLHLNPGHVVLLHFLHLLLDLSIELVLKAQTLHVVHVTVAVEQVPLQGCPGALHTHIHTQHGLPLLWARSSLLIIDCHSTFSMGTGISETYTEMSQLFVRSESSCNYQLAVQFFIKRYPIYRYILVIVSYRNVMLFI